MQARILRRLVAAASLAATVPLAGAEAPDSCGALPGAGEDPLGRRAEILAQYRQLPAACLQDIFTACASAANQTLMDLGSAAVCSFGYEALLSQRFGGNFRELMAWWQSQRATAVQ